jgi:hypothetical protein
MNRNYAMRGVTPSYGLSWKIVDHDHSLGLIKRMYPEIFLKLNQEKELEK